MEIQRSESIAKLALALSKAQAKMKGAKKDSNNTFFKAKYADLESVWDACRGPLTESELSIVQIPTGGKDGVGLVTILMHSSGEWIAGELLLNPKANDPQGIGSALSYGRRYSLAAFSGVYQTDDDGESAMDRAEATHKCDECGRAITSYTKPDGEVAPVGRVLEAGRKKWDRDLCGGCQIGLEKAKKAKAKPVNGEASDVNIAGEGNEVFAQGTVTEVYIQGPNKPLVVKMGAESFNCWHKSLFDELKESKGKKLELQCTVNGQYRNIEKVSTVQIRGSEESLYA